MALFKSKTALGQRPVITIDDSDIEGIPYEYVTEANLAPGDIIDLGPLPADVQPVDCKLFTDDLDSNGAPTITLSVGLLNAGKTDLNGGTNETFIVASTAGQTGGVARATSAAAYLLGSSTSERRLGIKVVAGAATGVGAGKKVMVVLDCKK